MAALMGVRESLMPSADKRKRRRKDSGPEANGPIPATSVPHVATRDEGPKQKKKKMETRSSAAKIEAPPVSKRNTSKAKIEVDVLPDDDEPVSIKSPLVKEGDGQEWKPEDRLLLLDQIQAFLPTDDNVKYSTMADKLCWSKLKVSEYSPDECKEEWLRISTKLRRFRTMSELLVDAKAWTKHPWNAFGKKVTKHPNMPKKPLTPYFRFFMAKRQKYSAKHPKMGVTDLTKELSKKYANLSERKKKKFVDAYNKEMEEWKAAMVEFRKCHPEAFDEDDKTGSTSLKHPFHVAPPKSTTAMQLYINEKYIEEKNSDLSRKQLYEKFKSQWFALNDNKKLKYIKLAIEAKEKYDTAVAKYRTVHPDYHPRHVKSFLSKAEQKIKDRFDGKPEKPPVNGYSLFTVETLPLLTDLPNIERLGEVSRRWKKLSEDKREAYNLKADERNQEYRIKYVKYVQGLPEDERKKLEEEECDKKKKQSPSTSISPPNSVTVERPQKPIAAVFLFINDKKDDFRKKYPQMDDNELQRLLVKEYNCLNEKDKVKYKKLEEEEKQKIAHRETAQLPATSNKRVKKVSFPGEPPKPPHSGYQLFSKELLTQLKDVKANERLQEIGRRWLSLSEDEKKQHNRRKDLIWAQYRKDLEKFKKSLSPKDRKRYDEMNKPSKKNRKKQKVEEENTESSAEEEEDEEAENGDASNTEADGRSVTSAESEDEDASSSSESEAGADDDDDGSSSEAGAEDEEAVEQIEKQLNENSNSRTQGKSSRLNAKDIYDDSSNDNSSEDSETDSSSASN